VSRTVAPEVWKLYLKFRGIGYAPGESAKRAGIAPATMRLFEARDPRSSGAFLFPEADGQRGGGASGPIPLKSLSTIAAASLEDLALFRRRYMGNESTPWQLDAAKVVLELLATDDKEFVVMNMAPGSGKTTFVHDLNAWMTCRDRSVRGLMASDSSKMAVRMMGRLRRTFERRFAVKPDSDLVRRGKAVDAKASLWQDFGRFKPEAADRWSREEFTVEQHDGAPIDEKEATWTAYGRDTAENLGMRYRFCVWDDVVNTKNMRTSDMRQTVENWWETEAEARLDPGGLLLVPGQRISSQDLYRHCLNMRGEDERPKYTHIVYPAHSDQDCKAVPGPDGRLGFDGVDYHAPSAPAWRPDGTGGCLLDPFRVTWRELQAVRKSSESRYRTVYQQEDASPEGVLVERVWVDGGVGSDGALHPGCRDDWRGLWELPKDLSAPLGIVTVDPSPTKMWAIQSWAYVAPTREEIRAAPKDEGPVGLRYLLDVINEQMSGDQLLDYNVDTHDYYGVLEDLVNTYKSVGLRLSYVVVEINAAQRFLLQHHYVRRWCGLRGVEIVPHSTHQWNKTDELIGIDIIKPHWKYGRVRLPNKGIATRNRIHPLVEQVTTWPEGRYDDQPMANWFLENKLPSLARPEADPHPARRPSWIKRKALVGAS